MQLKDDLAQLKSELALLREQQIESHQSYLQRIDDFSLKLERLADSGDQSTSQKQTESLTELQAEGTAQTIADLGLQVENGQLVFDHANTSNSALFAQQDNDKKQQENKANWEAGSEVTSGFVEQFSGIVLAPFTPLFSKVSAFYQHYQQRGLAAVFLMTIAGIITLTLGFTYLLQYSFNYWLSEIGKVCFAFICANTLLALGVFIYKRRAQMQDFASGLVGLGLIINYVSAYFSGPYFHLIPDWLSLLLLLLISLFGFFLSFKFETKVVAVLSLMGGSLAPIMLFNQTSEQLIYLPYLLVIGIFALLQSRLLRWPVLTELTALMHIACVELFIISQSIYFQQLSPMPILGLLSINLMFYVYGFSGLYRLKAKGEKSVLNKRLLVLPIALFAFTLLSITQLTSYSGYIFLFNALLFVVLYGALKSQPSLKVLALFLVGSFAGVAALQLLQRELLGIVLFAEGLALLYLGCKERFQSVRFEAYVLILLGTLGHFLALLEMLELSRRALSDFSDYGFIVLYLSLSAITLYSVSYLLKALIENGQHGKFEAKVFTFFRECLSINYVCLMLYVAAIINLDYALNIIPLITLLLLYLAQKNRLVFSEILAWLMLVPLGAAIALGILESDSARFSLQPLYAQLARVELFICFIGLYYWYKRFYGNSKGMKVARFVQLLCFMVLPILFIPKVLREYPDFISLAAWLSVLISLGLAYISRARVLFFEAHLLTIAAIVVTAFSCLQELWQGLLALSIAAILFAYLHQTYFKLSALAKLLLRFVWLLSPYYFALVSVVLVHTLMSLVGLPNWGIVMATLVVYFTQLLTIKPMPLVLRKSYLASLLLLIIPSIVTLLLHIEQTLNLSINSFLYMLAQLIILVSLYKIFSDNRAAFRLLATFVSRLYLQWAWHILLAVSYILWSYQFSNMIAAPLSAILLVLHGSSLMFISLKAGQANTIKLASSFFIVACCKVLFVDMANFLIIQKVIAFMLIGGILLAVSYFYQKMKNAQQP